MDHDSSPLTPPPSAPPGSSVSRRWPGASVWPNWDLLETPDGPFSIEREARLHRQAAGMQFWLVLFPLLIHDTNPLPYGYSQCLLYPPYCILHFIAVVCSYKISCMH